MRLLVWFAVSLFLYIFISCSRFGSHDGILIAVSIPPQVWFVSQIAGNEHPVNTQILVPPGQNPHNYEPTPRQIQSLSGADAWILSGSEFEITLRPKIESLFPNLIIIDGTQGVNFRLLEDHDHDDHGALIQTRHSSAASGSQSRISSLYDRHTWLGQEPSLILASHIKDTLSLIDKENENYYRQQYENLAVLIKNEFKKLKTELAPLTGKSVFVYHPSFGYFLDDLGIIQEAVETGGKEPTPRQLNDLMEKIKEEKPAAIFVQAQFPVNAARTIADSAGAQVIELDPLAQDWLENIKYMGQMLKNLIQ